MGEEHYSPERSGEDRRAGWGPMSRCEDHHEMSGAVVALREALAKLVGRITAIGSAAVMISGIVWALTFWWFQDTLATSRQVLRNTDALTATVAEVGRLHQELSQIDRRVTIVETNCEKARGKL